MSRCWDETIQAINAYAHVLAEKAPSAEITFICFSGTGFLQVRRAVSAKAWDNISATNIRPSGVTPLFDAVRELDGLISGAAGNILILTDGADNDSKRTHILQARAIIENWQASGYDVSFIGADYNAFSQARSLGISSAKTLNASKKKMHQVFKTYAWRSAASQHQTEGWSQADREALR